MSGTRPSRKDIIRDLEERKLLKIKIKF